MLRSIVRRPWSAGVAVVAVLVSGAARAGEGEVRRAPAAPAGEEEQLALGLTVELPQALPGADAAGGGDGSAAAIVALPGNLGFDGPFLVVGPTTLMCAGSEAVEGQDLNGDGDLLDFVPRLLDFRAGTFVDVPVAFWIPQTSKHWEGWLAVPVLEASQGQDLNGDGDLADSVPHLFRVDAPAPINTGLAARNFQLAAGRLVLAVSEEDQGAQDLNGDGDAADDYVIHWFDLATLQAHNTGLAAAPSGAYSVEFDTRTLAIRVWEADQGNADLNGSGSIASAVMHLVDMATGASINTGFSAFPTFGMAAGRVLVLAIESLQGADLDGDGDITPAYVPLLIDASTGAALNTGISLDSFSYGGGQQDEWFFFITMNLNPGASTWMLKRISLATGALQDISPISGPHFGLPVFSQGRAAFLVVEGQVDLNGDGDVLDRVLHLYDIASGTLTNLGLAGGAIALHGDLIGLFGSETGLGVGDANLDGDTSDGLLAVHRISTGATQIVPLAVSWSTSTGSLTGLVGARHAAFLVGEQAQGVTDLNGDGDTLDRVLHVLEVDTGVILNVAAAIQSDTDVELVRNQLYFSVHESAQGGSDLNGDGDVIDMVPHVLSF